MVLGFTNSYFSSLCVCVSVCHGDFLCVGLFGFKLTGSSFPFLCICIHMPMCVCMCVCVYSLMLSSENMSGIRSS